VHCQYLHSNQHAGNDDHENLYAKKILRGIGSNDMEVLVPGLPSLADLHYVIQSILMDDENTSVPYLAKIMASTMMVLGYQIMPTR